MPASERWSHGRLTRREAIRLGSLLAGGWLGVGGCSSDVNRPAHGSSTRAGRSPAASVTTPRQSPTPSGPRLSTAQLAGQRVIYSYPSLSPPAALVRRIMLGEVGGVIFFQRNIASRAQITDVIAHLRRAHRAGPATGPLLLMADQEGGLIRRLPGQPSSSQAAIGQAAKPWAAAASAGTAAGRNLASVGMNVNLAPVLDVASGHDSLLGAYQRSYGAGAVADAELGAAFIAAQQATGVAATAKHFPGLGLATASQNTDNRPVTLPEPAGRIRTVDELPYRAALAAGLRLVMLSWAVYPALDNTRPAGLSPIVVNDELRGRLGYSGATITDALEAHALQGLGDTGQLAVAAARAGMDLILCSSGQFGQGEDAAAALASALSEGQLSHDDFAATSARVSALKALLPRT